MNQLQDLWNALNGYKTYIVAVVTIVYAVVYYGLTLHDWATATTLILGGTGVGALRHGVAKSQA